MNTLEYKQKAIKILVGRDNAEDYDTNELQEKRAKWLSYLACNNLEGVFCQEVYKTENDVVETKLDQYNYFNKNWNIRLKTKTETWLDIDDLPYEESLKIISEIVTSLDFHNIHYCIWACEGGRAPKIAIYDVKGFADLTEFERFKAQENFWRTIAPFYFQHFDQAVWHDNQPLALEFAPHFKHKSPLTLIYESEPKPLPEVKIIAKKEIKEFKPKDVWYHQFKIILSNIESQYPTLNRKDAIMMALTSETMKGYIGKSFVVEGAKVTEWCFIRGIAPNVQIRYSNSEEKQFKDEICLPSKTKPSVSMVVVKEEDVMNKLNEWGIKL